jgi:hypothetical protein
MSSTLKYSDVKPEKIAFSKFKGHTLIRYKNNDLIIQSPWLNLSAYGIPRKDKYNQTENSRKHIKIPLDPANQEVSKFIDMLKDIDKQMVNKTFTEQFLGESHAKYEYSNIFRESQTEGRQAYIKLKLDTQFNEEQIIKTKIYKTKENNERQEIKGLSTMDDFSKVVSFRSDIRVIFKVVKCWTQAPNLKNPSYGLTLKATKIEVKDKEEHNEGSEGDFIDDSIEQYDISSDDSEIKITEKEMETWGDKSNPEPDTDGSDNEDDLCKKVNSRKKSKSPLHKYTDRGFNNN